MFLSIIAEETVDGIVFKYPNSNKALVYYDNQFYTLSEAFTNEILTHDNLVTIRSLYPAYLY